MMLRKMEYLFKRREDFCIETTLATRSLTKTVKYAQEQGYYVTVLYFWLKSPDIAVERVASRVRAGGHDIPEETIRRRYYTGLRYFFEYYMPVCDKWILADNTEPPFNVVAEGTVKGVTVKDYQKYRRIRSLLNLKEEDTPRSVESVVESIAKEISKAPIAHDGVPFDGIIQKEDDSR